MSWQETDELTSIFQAAIARVDPYRMVNESLSIDDETLHVITQDVAEEIDLSTFKRIEILGAGKASAPMAKAVEDLLGDRIDGGVISVKKGHDVPLKRIRVIEAGHPLPNERSLEAGSEILERAERGDSETLFINLISGGGSALIEAPQAVQLAGERVEVTLSELQGVTRLLLESGATIHEMNCIRKHLSRLKGGRFASSCAPAHSINLILSDVVGDDLHTIASGLTVADPTTYDMALAILSNYNLTNRVPESVMRILNLGARNKLEETPKPGDPSLNRTKNVLVGSNYLALKAAEVRANALGYDTIILTSQLQGEARATACFLSSVMKEVSLHHLPAAPPVCVLCGGETTVSVTGEGTGGRNTELALAMLREMAQTPGFFQNTSFLSAGTDGTDGPTDAAGAFATMDLLAEASQRNLAASEFLDRNDSYTFFDRINGLLKTGPTMTNVCDIQIALIRE